MAPTIIVCGYRFAMTTFLAALTHALMRNTGRVVHASWVVVCLLAASLVVPLTPAVAVGCILAASPGLLGLVLAGETIERRAGSRFLLGLSWTLPGLVASFAMGTALSAAALVFLAGPVALAAGDARKSARFAAMLAALAFILGAGASLLGPLSAGASSVLTEPTLWAGFAGFLALAGLIARTRLETRLERTQLALEEVRPAAEGFIRAPRPLLALAHDGTITAASKALHRVAPGTPRNLAGLPLDGLGFDEQQEAAIRQGLVSAGEGGGIDGGCFTFAVRAANGDRTQLDARAVATPAGFVVALDTPRQNAAMSSTELEALKDQRDAALSADQAKSEFLAAVSHELRTPLNAIIGFSDVMKQRLFGPMPARYAEYGDLIHESGTHLLELIGDVLDMSKIEADRYELLMDEFDARDVVEICAKMLRLRAEEGGLALYSEVGDAALEVRADRKALRQILLNLLSNAVKFTPTGGAVVVMARAQGPELVIAVGDSGVGIAADELKLIGRPYSQSSAGRETTERGSGLGLSLVRALAELHGGRMDVVSAPDQGTTVTVRLPVLVGEEMESSDPVTEVMDVHAQIRAAQEAGENLIETKARSA